MKHLAGTAYGADEMVAIQVLPNYAFIFPRGTVVPYACLNEEQESPEPARADMVGKTRVRCDKFNMGMVVRDTHGLCVYALCLPGAVHVAPTGASAASSVLRDYVCCSLLSSYHVGLRPGLSTPSP